MLFTGRFVGSSSIDRHVFPAVHAKLNVMKLIVTCCLLFVGFAQALAQTSIVVLPYTVRYTGNIPRKLTDEQIIQRQEDDGRKLQADMLQQLQRQQLRRKNAIVDLVVINDGQLEGLLQEHNMTYAMLETMTNEQIADSLNVTHVIRGSMNRTFIMSDELAIGIAAANVLTNSNMMTITSSMQLVNSLEGRRGAVVFSRQYARTATPMRTADRSLRDTFRKSARKIYRIARKNPF